MKKMIFGAAIMLVTATAQAQKEEAVLHDMAQPSMPVKEVHDDKHVVVSKDEIPTATSAETIPVTGHVDQKNEELPKAETILEKPVVTSSEEKSVDTLAPKAIEEKKVVAPAAPTESIDNVEKKKEQIDASEDYAASDDGEDEISLDAEPIDESFDSLDANEKSSADLSVDDEEEAKPEAQDQATDGEDTFSGSSNLDAF